jgi:alpha-L-fucosidase 2
VVSGISKKVISADSGPELRFRAIAGNRYLIEKHDAPAAAMPFAELSGTPALVAKKLGSVQIGLLKDEPGQAK